jgi:DNA polymerase delta subunit 1
VFNERQKALKISANAVYGFTGSNASKLLMAELAEATITWGAALLIEAAVWVTRNYPCQLIYGDTDSMMIKFDKCDVPTAMTLAREAAKKCSSTLFPAPITLAFEKVYSPFLLQQNKKYAGVKYTDAKQSDGILEVKGMECVRRDITPVVRSLMYDVLTLILMKRNLQSAVDATKRTIYSLLSNQLDLSQLTVTRVHLSSLLSLLSVR